MCITSIACFQRHSACVDPEGDRGSGPPLNNHKIQGFFAILVWITKLTSQHLVLGHHRPASEMPFKWRFAGGPLMARLKWYFDPLSPNQQRKECKKSWTPSEKLSGSVHAQETFYHSSKQYEPISGCPYASSLIRTHIVDIMAYQST